MKKYANVIENLYIQYVEEINNLKNLYLNAQEL